MLAFGGVWAPAGVATLCVEMGQAPEVLTGARGPHCEKVLSASDRKLTHSRHFVQCSSGGQGIEIREGARAVSRDHAASGAEARRRSSRTKRSSHEEVLIGQASPERGKTLRWRTPARPNHPVSSKPSPGIALIPHDQIRRGLLRAVWNVRLTDYRQNKSSLIQCIQKKYSCFNVVQDGSVHVSPISDFSIDQDFRALERVFARL